jgi:activator of the mannose operon (transcriptional antiterminator)
MNQDLAVGDHRLSTTPAERHQLVLLLLLTAEESMTRAQLEAQVPASLATLSRDLSSLEPWLAGFLLTLSRRPRIGVRLQGSEEGRRRALITLVLEANIHALLLDLALSGRIPRGKANPFDRPFQKFFLERIAGWQLDAAWRHISRVEDVLGRPLTDEDHLSLALSWAVAVLRVRAGHLLESRLEVPHVPGTCPESAGVNASADLLRRETGLNLPALERAQLTLEVRTSARRLADIGGLAADRLAEGGEDLAQLASLVAAEIGARVGRDLMHAEVLARMAEHLSRALDRARHGLLIHNPLLAQVRQAYPSLWLAAAEVLAELSGTIGVEIPAGEVAYVTMYMGVAHELNQRNRRAPQRRVVVACPSGGVTVWMMVSRLQRTLPELEIAEITSVRHLSRLDRSRIDAVISTARVSCREIPVITISPLVGADDVRRIRAVLGLPIPTGEPEPAWPAGPTAPALSDLASRKRPTAIRDAQPS